MSGLKKSLRPAVPKNTLRKAKGGLSDNYKKYQEWIKLGRPGGVFKP